MVEYRSATIDDTEGIVNLLHERFNIESKEEAKKVYLYEKKRDKFLLAVDNNKVIGFISWTIAGEPRHELVRIRRLAILPVQNKEEVAEELIRKTTDIADKEFKQINLKIRKAYVLVHSIDKERIEFYKKLGFVHEATLKDHYANNVDEFVMSLFFK